MFSLVRKYVSRILGTYQGTAAAYYGYHFRAHDSLEDVRATLYIFDQMQHSNKRELFEDYFWEDSEDEFDEEEEW